MKRNMTHITATLYKALMALLLYFAPISEYIHIVLALCTIDLALGMWRAIKFNNFKSRELRKTIPKFIGYTLAIIVAHMFGSTFIGQSIDLPKYVSGFIAFTELVSIYENLSEITGKKVLKELAVIITKQVKQKFKID